MERSQPAWSPARNVPPFVLPAEDERGCAALRELRDYPFFAPGGDTLDRPIDSTEAGSPESSGPSEAERLALSVALCQSHAKVRAIEKLLAEALAALHAPHAGTTIPGALPELLRGTGQQLIALGAHFRAEGQ